MSGHDASLLSALRRRATALRAEVAVLYRVCRDPRVPVLPKAIAAAVIAYAVSPIDLIPDFIPVLGYLDDLILVPAGLALALRLVPSDLLEEHRCASRDPGELSPSLATAGAVGVVSVWVLVLAAATAGFWHWAKR